MIERRDSENEHLQSIVSLARTENTEAMRIEKGPERPRGAGGNRYVNEFGGDHETATELRAAITDVGSAATAGPVAAVSEKFRGNGRVGAIYLTKLR
jgi:hypothetical protein